MLGLMVLLIAAGFALAAMRTIPRWLPWAVPLAIVAIYLRAWLAERALPLAVIASLTW